MSDDPTELLQRVAAGERQALAALYRLFEKPVYRFILSRLNDPHEAADILHDVFMDIWRVAASFQGRSQVRTWIFGIAYRKVIDAHRRRGRVTLTDEVPEPDEAQDSAEADYLQTQHAEHLRFCMTRLSDEHRAAIALAFYEDMSCAQIAEVAGVPEGTVKSRLYHARKLLQHCLTGRIGREIFA